MMTEIKIGGSDFQINTILNENGDYDPNLNLAEIFSTNLALKLFMYSIPHNKTCNLHFAKNMRLPGFEPGPLAWEASIITTRRKARSC